MTTRFHRQSRAARPGHRRGVWVRALVAAALASPLSLAAGTGTASAAPTPAAPAPAGQVSGAVLPAGAIEAGTGMRPDVNQVGCYVGDDFWDMKISGKWYCWANNGSVDIYPHYWDVTAIYTHNNSGTVWWYDPSGETYAPLDDWTNYYFDAPYDLHVTGFEITGR